MQTPKVTAVITLYNGRDSILDCIHALEAQSYPLAQIVVVDDGSVDGGAMHVESYARQAERVTVLRHESNRGLAAAVNTGIVYALSHSAEWVWLFDQDSIPQPDCLEHLINVIGCFPDVGILSPRFVNPDDPTMYNYSVRWSKNTGYIWSLQPTDPIHEYDVGITSGTLVSAPTVIAVGIFPEEFYVDLVDHEYYLRVREGGFHVFRVRQAILHHRIGNPKQVRFLFKNYTLAFNAAWRSYYFFRNDIVIHRKRLGTIPTLRRLLRLTDLVVVILIYEPDRFNKLRYMIEGIVDGFRGRMGQTHRLSRRTAHAVC